MLKYCTHLSTNLIHVYVNIIIIIIIIIIYTQYTPMYQLQELHKNSVFYIIESVTVTV